MCLRTLRIPKRWTQKAVAVEVGVDQSTVSKWFSSGDMRSMPENITHTRPDARHKINPILLWKICHHKTAKAYEELAKERQREQARRNQPQSQKVANLPPLETGASRDQAGEGTAGSGETGLRAATPLLSDIGVDKYQSHRWQRAAK
jgi:transcriptional regulator with XRE-family HTH domain